MYNAASAIALALASAREQWVQLHAHQIATIYRFEKRQGKTSEPVMEKHRMPNPVRCKVMAPADGTMIEEGAQLKPVADTTIRFPYGTELSENDWFEVDGKIYAATGPSDEGRGNALYVSIVCTKIKG